MPLAPRGSLPPQGCTLASVNCRTLDVWIQVQIHFYLTLLAKWHFTKAPGTMFPQLNNVKNTDMC